MLTPTVSVYFDGAPVDVSGYVTSVSLRRGRSRELDTFTSGACTVVLNNEDRRFDPLFTDGPYFGKIRPRLRVTVVADLISLFDGFVEDWNFNYSQGNRSVAEIVCIDGLALLSQTALTSFTNTQDTPGARIQTVLGRPEVSYAGAVSLTPGYNVMQADTVSDNTNTLSYLQKVADTDVGRLFVDGAGVLRYRDRNDGVVQEPRVVFAEVNSDYVDAVGLLSGATLWLDPYPPEPLRTDDDAVAQTVLQDATLWFDAAGDPDYIPPVMPFHGIEVEFGSEFLFNRIQVSREGGSTITVSAVDSQATYGVRTLSRDGYLFLEDTETTAFAEYLITLYAEPNVRIASHNIDVNGLSDLHKRYVFRLEIGDVVRTVWTPNDTGNVIDRDSIIEGVEHTITPSSHRVRLQLTPFSRAGFILDDPDRGLLDTSEVTY